MWITLSTSQESIVRYIIYKYKKVNPGDALTAVNILETLGDNTAITSMYNMESKGKFKVLADRTFSMTASKGDRLIKRNIKLGGVHLQYDDSNTAEPNNFGLGLLVLGPAANGNDANCNMIVRFRTFYYDT